MFIDRAKISVKAGDGGRGCDSLYRDKYQRLGVPDGGDGGRGADVVIRADRHLATLLDFSYRRHFTGDHGGHGSGKQKKGKDMPPLEIRVPCGTVVTDKGCGKVLRDLKEVDEEVVVARGGKGGLGSRHHCDAMPGEKGEQRELQLDLKIIADVGIIGFPNVGKSSLVAAVSNAHPTVAAYPFTTKTPVLGMAGTGERKFIVADMPGLIEGASAGRGLGDRFLRHIERTRVLVHLIDMSACEGRDPVEDYRTINRELKRYSPEVARKPQVLAANKMDCEGAAGNLARFRKSVRGKIYPVSALQKTGLEELLAGIGAKL